MGCWKFLCISSLAQGSFSSGVSGSKFSRSLCFTAASLIRLALSASLAACRAAAARSLSAARLRSGRREAAASGLPPQACSWASRGTSDGLALGRWGRSSVWCSCSSRSSSLVPGARWYPTLKPRQFFHTKTKQYTVSQSELSLLSACVRLCQLRKVHHSLQQSLNPWSRTQSAATDGSPACCTSSLMLRVCAACSGYYPLNPPCVHCLRCCCTNSGACPVWPVLFGAL